MPTCREMSKVPAPRIRPPPKDPPFCIPPPDETSVTTGTIFCCRCACEVNSGTTPPYASCTFWLAMTLLQEQPVDITAADVSSHEDSIPQVLLFSSDFFLVTSPSQLDHYPVIYGQNHRKSSANLTISHQSAKMKNNCDELNGIFTVTNNKFCLVFGITGEFCKFVN